MRYARSAKILGIAAVLGLCLFIVPSAHAQRVSVGVGIGVPAPAYVGPVGPPTACAYGYYSYYPYACAPYGYYGPSWFVGGVFIGAGPWYHGYWGHPGYWGRPGFYAGRPGYIGRPGFRPGPAPRGPAVVGRGPAGGFHGAAGFRGGHR